MWKLQSHYVNRGELLFATLDKELQRSEDYGITIKLKNSAIWELPYVSIVDCRGQKRQRRYHTKWHEIAHLLILTDQTRLEFRRSHDSSQPKSAEESLVDSIAGEMSFYPDLITPHLDGPISFERIEQIREALCPEASMYSAALNLFEALADALCLARGAARSEEKRRNSPGELCVQRTTRENAPRSPYFRK